MVSVECPLRHTIPPPRVAAVDIGHKNRLVGAVKVCGVTTGSVYAYAQISVG